MIISFLNCRTQIPLFKHLAIFITMVFSFQIMHADDRTDLTLNLTSLANVHWQAIKESEVKLDYNDPTIIACGRAIVAIYEYGTSDPRVESVLEEIINSHTAQVTNVPDWLTTADQYRLDLKKLGDPALSELHLFGTQRGTTLSELARVAKYKLKTKTK
ncbi:hypothetical protein WJU23_03080 [Prosthecobacter sp. SYSU 5D2]|uniref:hypothetical protein n=1 Tax=Prosthecobacter sp. SYSU 5D2 TaxID=3134134 RepID=UPI0031FF2A13